MQRPGRSQLRTPFVASVTLTLLDDTRVTGTGIDLSAGGIRLRTAGPVRPATYCALRFEAGPAAPVLAFGHVIYSEALDGAYQTGVQFLRIDADGAALIGRLLAPATAV